MVFPSIPEDESVIPNGFRDRSDTVESDPFVLDELRAKTRAQLEELKPDVDGAQWRVIAREQMLHWLKWVRVYDDLAPHFSARPKNHRISGPAAFGAFFVHEPEGTDAYWEIPLLLALLQGDRETAKHAAAILDIPLTDAVLAGPFSPFDRRGRK